MQNLRTKCIFSHIFCPIFLYFLHIFSLKFIVLLMFKYALKYYPKTNRFNNISLYFCLEKSWKCSKTHLGTKLRPKKINKWAQKRNCLNFRYFLFSIRLTKAVNFKDFESFDLGLIWWIMLEWTIFENI